MIIAMFFTSRSIGIVSYPEIPRTYSDFEDKRRPNKNDLTFPDHGHPDRHAHELALGPHVRVHTHPLLLALGVEARHGGMMGHLLSHEAQQVRLLRVPLRGLPGGVLPPRHLPGAVEGLADDGVVGLLGNGALAALVEGGEVVLDEADHAVLGAAAVRDGDEEFRVGHEVGVHLQQGALLQDESGEDHLQEQSDRDKPETREDWVSLGVRSFCFTSQGHPNLENIDSRCFRFLIIKRSGKNEGITANNFFSFSESHLGFCSRYFILKLFFFF